MNNLNIVLSGLSIIACTIGQDTQVSIDSGIHKNQSLSDSLTPHFSQMCSPNQKQPIDTIIIICSNCIPFPLYTQIMVLTFLYFLLWLLLSVALSLVLAVYIQLAWACPTITDNASPETCFTFALDDRGNTTMPGELSAM